MLDLQALLGAAEPKPEYEGYKRPVYRNRIAMGKQYQHHLADSTQTRREPSGITADGQRKRDEFPIFFISIRCSVSLGSISLTTCKS